MLGGAGSGSSGSVVSGGDPALDRAAWTTLATGHGANRAAWIVRSYQPTNLADRPVRLDASDVFLPITLDSALAPGEATALAAFWRAVWVAAGDATAVGVATTTLELAVGAARAAELIAAHVPANLDAAPPDGVSREDVTVSVPFLLLPSVETKRETWSQAPRARILPDRFVFVGYERENDPTPGRSSTPAKKLNMSGCTATEGARKPSERASAWKVASL